MIKISGILKKDLEELYIKRKISTYQIAKYYKCSQTTIWKLLHGYNISSRRPGNYLEVPYSALRELYENKRLSSRKIAKMYNCAYSTIDRKIRKYGFKIRNLAQAHIVYPRKSFSGNLIEKAYLIGFSIGDLRARKMYKNSETIVVDCGSTKPDQINLINKLFRPYGRVWVSKIDERGRRQIQAQLDLSFDFLLDLDGSIDPWILNDKDDFSAFLSGFTDAEGCFGISSGRAFYSLGNYNKRILNEIYIKLGELGINCSKLSSDNLKGYKDKQGYIRKHNYFTLRVNKKQDLMRLSGLLSRYLKHKKRVADMNKAKMNIVERNRRFGNLGMS